MEWKGAKPFTMLNATLRATALSLLTALALPSMAATGTLHADGILVVKGAELNGTTITVVPHSAPAYQLPAGTKRFTLSLPVDDYYLVSFTREGCPTKEIYFDATVPAEHVQNDFDFPFMVTLEHLPAERMFSYEGPVGFVRYLHGIEDFGYETQYIVKMQEHLKERMDAVQSTGVDPKPASVAYTAMVVDRPMDGGEPIVRAATPELGTVAPNVHDVPALVHRVVRPEDDEPVVHYMEPEASVLKEEPVAEVVEELPLPAPAELVVEEPQPLEVEEVPVMNEVPTEVEEPVNVPVAITPVWTREEETIIEKRMVVKIVRFTRNDGVKEEFRRVAHAYGQVFFFQDARSITERDYLGSIATR